MLLQWCMLVRGTSITPTAHQGQARGSAGRIRAYRLGELPQARCPGITCPCTRRLGRYAQPPTGLTCLCTRRQAQRRVRPCSRRQPTSPIPGITCHCTRVATLARWQPHLTVPLRMRQGALPGPVEEGREQQILARSGVKHRSFSQNAGTTPEQANRWDGGLRMRPRLAGSPME